MNKEELILLDEAIEHCNDVILNLKQKGNCEDCLKWHKKLKEWLIDYKFLKEKSTDKKPNLEGDGYDEQGQLIYDTWICPNCEKHYELDYDEYDYCPNCGQKILWGNEDD